MNIESGWRFFTADFSVNASGDGTELGSVTLVRIPSDVARWNKITDSIGDSDDYPPLYVSGTGVTFEEAVVGANLTASHLPELV